MIGCIHDFFPIPVFCFVWALKYLRLHKLNKTRLNVCVNEMAPFELFAAVLKGCSTYDRDGIKGSLPTSRDG